MNFGAVKQLALGSIYSYMHTGIIYTCWNSVRPREVTRETVLALPLNFVYQQSIWKNTPKNCKDKDASLFRTDSLLQIWRFKLLYYSHGRSLWDRISTSTCNETCWRKRKKKNSTAEWSLLVRLWIIYHLFSHVQHFFLRKLGKRCLICCLN